MYHIEEYISSGDGHNDTGENEPSLIASNIMSGIYAVRNWSDLPDKLEQVCQKTQKVVNDYIAVAGSGSSNLAFRSLSRLFEVFFDAFSVFLLDSIASCK